MKPDCLLSENINDHNFVNKLPTSMPDGFRLGSASQTCLDCFTTCHMVFYGKEYNKPNHISWVRHEGFWSIEDEEKNHKLTCSLREKVRSFVPFCR